MRGNGILRKTVAGVLLVAAAVWIEGFTFKAPSISLRLVFEAISREAGVGIAMSEDVRGDVSVDAEQVDPIQMMEGLAKQSGLAMRKVELGDDKASYVLLSEAAAGPFDRGMEASGKAEAKDLKRDPLTIKSPNLSGRVVLGMIEKSLGAPIHAAHPPGALGLHVVGVDPLKLLAVVAALNGASVSVKTGGGGVKLQLVRVK